MVGSNGTVSAAFVTRVAHVLQVQFGADETDLSRWPERVPLAVYYGLLADAASRVEGPVGFEVARGLEITAFEELGFLVRSCETLGDAIEAAVRFMRTLTDERIRLDVTGDVASVCFAPLGPSHPGHRPAAEVMLGDMLHGLPLEPESPGMEQVRLELSGPAAPDAAAYGRAAGTEVVFEARDDRVVFPAKVLRTAMPQADAGLATFMRKRVQERAQALPPLDDLVGRTRTAIQDAIEAGQAPTTAGVARVLATSERSLQRSLRAEGAGFLTLVDDVRAGADMRLRDLGVAPADIAERLGFSSTNAYYRARSRWRERG